jgi:hypothetical protein
MNNKCCQDFCIKKPEGKRSCRGFKSSWEYNIKMDLKEMGCVGLEWTQLAVDRDHWQDVLNKVMDIWVP